MKFTILFATLFFFSACATFNSRESASAPMVPPKPLSIQIGKNWKVIEEAPNLSDERGRLPFQTEQSMQPEGLKTATPEENRKIETPR